MKKILSALLVVAMLASMFAVFALPTAAIVGQFDTHDRATHEVPGYDGDIAVPGYEYTEDGFHMTTVDWGYDTPFSHMSTKNKVDLKNGVYMQVRVDTFNYDAGDKWLNFNIWSQPTLEPGSSEEEYGYGVSNLIRFVGNTSTLSYAQWKIKQFTSLDATYFDDAGKAQVDGKNVLTLVVTYNSNSGYGITLNGVAAPQAVVDYMNQTYSEDSMAYIGFTMFSTKKGGEQSATILKFGESADTATKPMGDDKKAATTNDREPIADIIDASTVAEGQPAIIMSGDKANSQIKATPGSATGSRISITDDNLIRVVAINTIGDCGIWNVKNSSSYDIKDFPVVLCLFKNYCNCGTDDGTCSGWEAGSLYLCTGEEISPSPDNNIAAVDSSDPYFITNDDGSVDKYAYFYYDVTDELKTTDEEGNVTGRFDGRINATRFDFVDIDMLTPGANEFEVVMQCFFRTVEDAEAYVEAYLADKGWVKEEVTDAPTDTETDPQETEPQDTDPQETDPVTPDETDKQTDGGNTASGGCFGTVGFGAIAIVAVAATATYVTFKKKD